MAERHDILVATNASSPEIPSVEALARSYGLETLVDNPNSLYPAARRFEPDIIFSVYYRTIVSAETLALAPLGAYNFHPSLLPRHRGCFSAPWSIIEGDRETGVTCHEMTPDIDAGDIVDQSIVEIDDAETGISLYYKLADATVALFPRVLAAVSAGCVTARPQSGESGYHPRRVPYGGVIDPGWSRAKIERFIRAMFYPPYPPAILIIEGKRYPIRSLADYDRIAAEVPRTAEPTHCESEHPQIAPMPVPVFSQ